MTRRGVGRLEPPPSYGRSRLRRGIPFLLRSRRPAAARQEMPTAINGSPNIT
jgi:hypothetical protein